ncbi:MAG TPA: beta-galactosidase, partial [Armatimonadota bacterium]
MSVETSRPTAKLEFHQGRPVIIFNGKPISHAMYSDPMVHVKPVPHSKPEIWLERYKDFRDSGVHVYSIGPVHWVNGNPTESRFWSGDGVYPDVSADDAPFCVDKQAQALLEMDPEATFFVRFGDEIPKAWIDANPDIIQQSYTGERREFYNPQPSLGSEKGLQDVCTFIRRVIEHCEAQPWSDRVFAYMYYPRGEGITNLNVSGFMFDVCPAMQETYKKWMREHYADEATLQAAWGDPAITFDTVRVPTDAEWRGDMDKVEHWVGGEQLRRYRDYWELQQTLFIHWYRTLIRTVVAALAARPVVFGIDMAKQPMLGWQHNLSFSGVGPSAEFLNMFTGTGSIDTAELLDEPGLDMLCTPADYTARTMGYGWEPEGIADSLHLRGKAMLVENDARSFNPGQEDHTLGAFRNPAEVKAGLLRNAAWSLTRGHFDYWMIAGGQYFHHPEVQEQGIRTVAPLLDAAHNWPHKKTEHAIAMIIDDASDSLLAENGTSGYLNLAVLWQRILGLAHCGIPYRVYLFSDLQRENMPDYRCYLFPNLFKMDEERLALLQRKVFRDGRMAIFGPSTGITDGKHLSADWASRLLGVEMELVNKHAPRRVIVQGPHPIAQALPASLVYGDSQPYGPILIPAKDALEPAGADHLGMATTFWGINRPGLFVNDCEEYQIAWSAAMPLPANLLRELARAGGCHVWCEEDDVILASDTIAAIHSVKAGKRT